MDRWVRTAVLISGRGSNMISLIEAAKPKNFPAKIELVISNRAEAAGLEKAEKLGIRTLVIDHTQYPTRRSFEQVVHSELTAAAIELICCAGFMRVLSPWFVSRWPGRILNIHPSLLPRYKGLNTHQRALDAGDSVHGCSVHLVTEELDGGDVIAQTIVNIKPDDTKDILAERVLQEELRLYPKALKAVATELRDNIT